MPATDVPDFAIATAVDREYLGRLRMSLPTWAQKPQFAARKLYVFWQGRMDLEWIRDYFPRVQFIKWEMGADIPHREQMLSAFVLGAAKHIEEAYYLKLDADAFCKDSQDVFEAGDFAYALCAHPWGYTKPAWWAAKMKAWTEGKDYQGPREPGGHYGWKRLISWCCLHDMRFVKQAAEAAGERLPIPSHDSYLCHLAAAFGCTMKRKDMKEKGVDHAHREHSLRDQICSYPTAWNPHFNHILLGKVQIEVTSACNLKCANCDRNCGTAPTTERMSLAQIHKFQDESVGHKWDRIDIIGGEPTLHPELWQIGKMLSECAEHVRLTTNGLLPGRLEGLPKSIEIRNSGKDKKECQQFDAVNVAPVDVGIAAQDVRACSIPWRCGMALTRYGFFSCGAGASIARVHGLDIGIHRLADVTPEALRAQMARLCPLCGHSMSTRKTVTEQETSPTWAKAFAAYAKERPKLTEY